ncbi:MaoC family dehydratase [Entomospira culicis]|uniref:MaoC family dehydratase n=1 Tax=Entomospira culicis TaxID=2719989 RepID=A0A968GF95_9SPIO|nr:MaoC family dehydratase [Entomospira culicis]NIZ18992.1 MaoC family dehydratase [Entomospira culicis]NIZ69207.1 MaoC family dehydratase [Entomospira culicis]WDI37793.1 MaoC family dehydratase [Entomospira culicis]WDI39421.1 MaoC family dehydratase [Entomospira culicis]
MKFSELEVGMKASLSRTVTEADVAMFAGLSMDFNPAHMNEEAAKSGVFKQRVAHGMLSAGFISAILGTKLPGEGSIYMGQTLQFTAPVFLGDTVTATCEITQLIPEKHRVILSTTCTKQDGTEVIKGEATILKRD